MSTAHQKSIRLVIDTSITRAASTSNDQNAQNCLLFLRAALDHQHQIVITPELLAEWKRNHSLFWNEWIKSVFARRLAYREPVPTLPQIREKIIKFAVGDNVREELLHDLHLIEAALATDKAIASLNDADKRRFSRLCDRIAELKPIVWVNPSPPDNPKIAPCKSAQECLEWLANGAPADENCMLGNLASNSNEE